MQTTTAEILLSGAAQIESPIPEDGNAMVSVSHRDKDCRDFALLEHAEIVETWHQLGRDWVAFTRRVRTFKDAKSFRFILDPVSGLPFTRFESWAKAFLGQSVSGIFADLKTLRELKGVLSDPELALMSKENARHLVRRKQQNKLVDAVILDDAAHLKAAEFVARYPVEDTSKAGKSGPELCQLGPFTVAETTAEIFSLAINVAKRQCEGIGQAGVDSAICLTEKMPKRYSTRRGYEVWLRCYVVPRWGVALITDLQARPVDLWLQSLDLQPKSLAEIRGLIGRLWDFAMWCEVVPVQRNPMELVRIPGSSKRSRTPRSLSFEEFQRFLARLGEPFRTMALVLICFGLRISECLALKWSDVDWFNNKLSVERSIVRQRVDNVKTVYSKQSLPIAPEMLEIFKDWKKTTQFSRNEDWIFASPAKLGRQPWCYDQVLREFMKAAEAAGIGKIGTHSMRHSYRSWLDAVGTTIAVQKKLMRHADIRTTMNVYGDVVTDEMQQASGKVSRLALNSTQAARNGL